jgi:hypothetical protein
MTVLTGHTTQETAYLVNDYPYGFRLRCKIRYWLEYKQGHGFRLVSQTTNPKREGEHWNKPKSSTYCILGVMLLDDEEHVTWKGWGVYSDAEELDVCKTEFIEFFDDRQKKALEYLEAVNRANKRLKWKITEPGGTEQTQEEQSNIVKAVVQDELRKGRETQ